MRSIYGDPRGLTAAANDKVAPDAEFDFTANYPDRPIMRGVEEFRRFHDSGPWAVHRSISSPSAFDVDHEHVLLFERVSAIGHESGARVDIRAAHEFTIRDGLVVRFKVYGGPRAGPRSRGLRSRRGRGTTWS